MGILKDFKYHSPSTIQDAIGLLSSSGDALILGGGTIIFNNLKKAKKYPKDVIGLRRIEDLKGIKDCGKEVSIGAMTTVSEIIESELIGKNFPSLIRACSALGTTPIRNVATIGGNVSCRYSWVDLPSVLISLSAKVSIKGVSKQYTMGIDEFISKKLLEKFIITDIILPKPKNEKFVSEYFRHTRSMEVDVPVCALAFFACLEKKSFKEVRIVINTAVSSCVDAKALSSELEGRHFEDVDLASFKERVFSELKNCGLDENRIDYICNDFEILFKRLRG